MLEKLTRVCFILGDVNKNPDQRREYYEKGRAYADQLLKERPQGAAGHYWLGLNLCGQADAGGALLGRQVLPQILEELTQHSRPPATPSTLEAWRKTIGRPANCWGSWREKIEGRVGG